MLEVPIGNPIIRPEIVFILAPPRSFTSVVCAMLGQHPQMYAVPELRLFGCETVGEWIQQCSKASYQMASGTLRAVAELVFGDQTGYAVTMSQNWLRQRSHWSTRQLTKFLGRIVHPRILVEKSPSIVYLPAGLQRMYRMFPNARFIHLLRHPRGHGESVMKLKRELERKTRRPLPAHDWIVQLCSFPQSSSKKAQKEGILDPQHGWYVLNQHICNFLDSVPPHQKTRIRGEDLLAQPDASLSRLVGWMGLRTDRQAIDAMKHPERSPYVGLGPAEAVHGNDRFFLAAPNLRVGSSDALSLEGPLSWRPDGAGFLPEIKSLARSFGYAS